VRHRRESCRTDIRIRNLEATARSCRNVIGLFSAFRAPKYNSCLLASLRVPVNLSCHLELAKFQHLMYDHRLFRKLVCSTQTYYPTRRLKEGTVTGRCMEFSEWLPLVPRFWFVRPAELTRLKRSLKFASQAISVTVVSAWHGGGWNSRAGAGSFFFFSGLSLTFCIFYAKLRNSCSKTFQPRINILNLPSCSTFTAYEKHMQSIWSTYGSTKTAMRT